ncbi:S-layer homology domain-containing protein [[Clostridium] colinum]|uniref:S-layer homology domain-containing protein n=1 Tax=[Clostridium] colinum TaxID=36835 RepID=UPI002024EDCF|nr:S-layer homology domain-containing protein [[Clostridium] colinum]
MKKNISSKAIKAMAIGMTVNLATISIATVGGISLNIVKAEDTYDDGYEEDYYEYIDIKNPESIKLTEYSYAVTVDRLLFKFVKPKNKEDAQPVEISENNESEFEAIFIGIVSNNSNLNDEIEKKDNDKLPFMANIDKEGNLVIKTSEKNSEASSISDSVQDNGQKEVKVPITQIGNDSDNNYGNEGVLRYYKIDKDKDPEQENAIAVDQYLIYSFSKFKKVTKIGANAFRDITIEDYLIFPKVTEIGKNAFWGSTINGNLILPEVSKLNLFTFRGATINGDLLLKKAKEINGAFRGTYFTDEYKGITVKGKLVLGDNAIIDDMEFNYTNIGELDLSKCKVLEVNPEYEKEEDDDGPDIPSTPFINTKIGILTLPKDYKGANGAFFNSKIGVLNINANTFATDAFNGEIFSSETKFSEIGTLNLPDEFTGQNHSFKYTTIKNLDLSNVKDISIKNDFEINEDEDLELGLEDDLGDFEDFEDFESIDTAFAESIIENLTHNGTTIMGDGFFYGSTIKNLKFKEGLTRIEDKVFAQATIPKEVVLPEITSIGSRAFDIGNIEPVTIKLPAYKPEYIDNIEKDAFSLVVTVILPAGTSEKDRKALEDKLTGDFGAPTVLVDKAEENIVSTTNVGTYKFEMLDKKKKEVALTGFEPTNTNLKSKMVDDSNFKNGVITLNGSNYKLTQIGVGTPITNLTDKDLEGHTNNVITIADNAFKGNKNIITANFKNVKTVGVNAFEGASNLRIVNLPKVTKISDKAFASTNVIEVNLGKDTTEKIEVKPNIFDEVTTINKVETNNISKDNVIDAIKNSSSDKVNLVTSNGSQTVSSEKNSVKGMQFNSSSANIGVKNKTDNTEINQENKPNKKISVDTIKLPKTEGKAKDFTDVKDNHWAKAHIDKLSTAGIINGDNGKFNPNGNTKRADATIMIVNLLGLTPENNNKFTDVNPLAYYAPYVGTASTYGIVSGSNGIFNPEQIISRQDTMVMIAQVLKSLNSNVNTDVSVLNKFSDANKVSAYANESVAILVNAGIISGNNGKLNPNTPVTRAEMVTIMSKLYDILIDVK